MEWISRMAERETNLNDNWFENSVSTRHEIDKRLKYIKKKVNNELKLHEAREERCRRVSYKETQEINNVNWRKCIAEMIPSNSMIVHSFYL